MQDFDQALEAFAQSINKDVKANASTLADHMTYEEDGTGYFGPVIIKPGQKRVKLITGNGQSVYCFVDKDTGNILKAASFKVPAKGARGNIYDPSTYQELNKSDTGWLYAVRC